MIKDESYWIVKCYGTEQGWSSYNLRILEKPKEFVGYISSIDWGPQASRERLFAHHFFYKPTILPEDIGPWYYRINRVGIIKVTRKVEEFEEVEQTT